MSETSRRGDRHCATATLLRALTSGLSVVREPRLVRERFEQELRTLVKASSVAFLEEPPPAPGRPNVVLFNLPGRTNESRGYLSAIGFAQVCGVAPGAAVSTAG